MRVLRHMSKGHGVRQMVLLALFPVLMIGTVLVVALSIHDEGHAWDGSATFASAK